MPFLVHPIMLLPTYMWSQVWSCVVGVCFAKMCVFLFVYVFCLEWGEEIGYIELQMVPKFEVPTNVVEVIVLS